MATWTLSVSASGTPHDMGVDTTQKIGFFGDNFNDTITVAEYQHSIHIMNADNSDECDNHPTNKLPSLSYEVGGSTTYHRHTASSGSINLNTFDPADEGCLKYTFTHGSAVSTSGGIYFAYQGAVATPPTEVACWAFEPPDASWSTASGNANALGLTDQGSSANHNYYVGVSAGPETVGSKTGWKLRFELTYY